MRIIAVFLFIRGTVGNSGRSMAPAKQKYLAFRPCLRNELGRNKVSSAEECYEGKHDAKVPTLS